MAENLKKDNPKRKISLRFPRKLRNMWETPSRLSHLSLTHTCGTADVVAISLIKF